MYNNFFYRAIASYVISVKCVFYFSMGSWYQGKNPIERDKACTTHTNVQGLAAGHHNMAICHKTRSANIEVLTINTGVFSEAQYSM